MTSARRTCGRGVVVLAVLALVMLSGCGDRPPTTHAVRGKVVFTDGDVKKLADAEASVEFVLESDPSIRAYGQIQPDGSFEMQTPYKGKTLSGAAEGTHHVRILLQEMPPEPELDDDGKPYPAKKGKGKVEPPVNLRFLDTKTSKLTCTVPTSDEFTVTVSKK